MIYKIKNKKAWMRVLEAFISILIIASALIIINSTKLQNIDFSELVIEKQKQLLNIISNNENYRSDIIVGDLNEVNEFVNKNIPNNLNFTVNLCGINDNCNQGIPVDKDIYVSETIITANLTDYPSEVPKKVRLIVWVK